MRVLLTKKTLLLLSVTLLFSLLIRAHAQVSTSLNVCAPAFQCSTDLECQLPGERMNERWACRRGQCTKVQCIIDLECAKGQACLENECKAPQLSTVGGPCDITAGLRCPEGSQCDLLSKKCVDSSSVENSRCDNQMFPPCGNGLTCIPFDDGVLRCVDPRKTVRGLGDACSENVDQAIPPTLCALGLSCVNHVCTPTKVPRITEEQCDDTCRTNAECETGVCVYGKCSFGYLQQGESCVDGVQCESGRCTNGKCSGEDCSTRKCKDTEVCIAIPGAQPMCITDPGSCLPTEVWLDGNCTAPPKINERCDPLTAPCPSSLYCDPYSLTCKSSPTLGKPCSWTPNQQLNQLTSDCTEEAGEKCFCNGQNPICKRIGDDDSMPSQPPPPPPPPQLNSKRNLLQIPGESNLEENIKEIEIGDSCKRVLQDPYSLLCVRELESPGRLQSPLLSFAFLEGESEKARMCRDFWAKFTCCNVCLQSALDQAAELDPQDLVARGLPGLSCSVTDGAKLSPMLGISNGTCVIGPRVPLQTRAWYRANYCAGDFLRNFVDKNPHNPPVRSMDNDPNAQNTTRRVNNRGDEVEVNWIMLTFALMIATISLHLRFE